MHSAPEYVPPPPKKWTDALVIPKLDYSAFFDADLGKFPYDGARATTNELKTMLIPL